jgi:hypothetical protein
MAKNDDSKIYRVRDLKTGFFYSMLKSGTPTFNKRGKDWKKKQDVLDFLIFYNLTGAGKWPKVEIVTYVIAETENAPDPTKELKAARVFID